MYVTQKASREFCKPRQTCPIQVEVEEGMIKVLFRNMTYVLYVDAPKTLLCLIADSLPEPVRCSELESFGFRRDS